MNQKCFYCINRMVHKDDLLKPMFMQRIACKQGQLGNFECPFFSSTVIKNTSFENDDRYTNGK